MGDASLQGQIQRIIYEEICAAKATSSVPETRAANRASERILALFGWRPIAEHLRDGSHILACDASQSFGWLDGKPLAAVQTVVHWFDDPEEPGFYTSVNELEPQRPFPATHWKPLDSPAA